MTTWHPVNGRFTNCSWSGESINPATQILEKYAGFSACEHAYTFCWKIPPKRLYERAHMFCQKITLCCKKHEVTANKHLIRTHEGTESCAVLYNLLALFKSYTKVL